MHQQQEQYSYGRLRDLTDEENFGEGFEHFYAQKIAPSLESLAEKEAAYHNWRRFTIYAGISCFIIFLLAHFTGFYGGNMLAATLFILCVAGVIFSASYADKYLDNFKEKIIGEIIECIHPGSVYKPMGYISHREYKASGLFRKRYTHFDGDDFWQSEYMGIPFHCSEIVSRAQYAASSELIFRGLFFTAHLPSQLRGGTYIWSRSNIQLPATVADEQYRLYPLPEVKKYATANVDFNSLYSIYTTNGFEADLLLTPVILQHMVEMRKKLGKEIVYSFVGPNCYVAVPFDENLLEPSMRGVRDKKAIRNYFYTILLVFSIIKKLELNRIG